MSALANEVNICNVSLTHVARYSAEVSGQKGGKCFSGARRQEGGRQLPSPHCSSSFQFNLVNNANALQRRPVSMTTGHAHDLGVSGDPKITRLERINNGRTQGGVISQKNFSIYITTGYGHSR